jgi:hypothetical protein
MTAVYRTINGPLMPVIPAENKRSLSPRRKSEILAENGRQLLYGGMQHRSPETPALLKNSL